MSQPIVQDETRSGAASVPAAANPSSQGLVKNGAGRATKLYRLCKQRGIWPAVSFLLKSIAWHRVTIVYEASLREPLNAFEAREGEELLFISNENLDACLAPPLRAFLGGDASSENIDGVRAGDKLFVLVDHGIFAYRGYIFFSPQERKLIGEEEDIPLIGYCFTAPAARGRGFYRRALAAKLEYLHKEGFRRVLIQTDPGNRASRKGVEAAGFKFAWECRVLVLFRWLVFRINRGPGFRHHRIFSL